MDEKFILKPTPIGRRIFKSLAADNKVVFRHGHIAIQNYRKGDNPEFEKYLSVWNQNKRRYEMFGGYFYKSVHELRINRGYPLETLKRFFKDYKFEVENDPYPHDKVEFNLTEPPKDDIQVVILYQMLGLGSYEHLGKYTQRVITAYPGGGKTYMAIACQATYKCRALIVTSNIHICDQWIDSYAKFTDLDPKSIMVIDGSKDLEKIRVGKIKHDIVGYIMVINTFNSYVRHYGRTKAQEVLYKMNVYMKVCDEVHKNVKLLNELDALSNFRMNFYLTATLARSDDSEHRIFKKLFSNAPRIGEGLRLEEEKHVNILIKKYNWNPDPKITRSFVLKAGIHAKLYEEALITHAPNIIRREIMKMVLWAKTLKHEDGKILFMTSSIAGIEFVRNIIEVMYAGNVDIGIYHSKISDKEKAVAKTKQIIIATAQGLGTGTDIVDLQFAFNLETYSSGRVSTTQISQRVRASTKFEVYYVEFVNWAYYKTLNQFFKREDYIKDNAKGSEYTLID